MKTKTLIAVLSTVAILGLTGCGSKTIHNLSPKKMPVNPSGIYTLSMSTDMKADEVAPGTMSAAIVIDGKEYAMRPSSIGNTTFDFDYRMPGDRNTAKYYFVLRYGISMSGVVRTQETASSVHELQLANRYVFSMESARGRVGSENCVIGRGFRPTDRVLVGGMDANAQIVSPFTLKFSIPALDARRGYEVILVGAMGDVPVGSFYVDPSQLHMTPEKLDLRQGERAQLDINIDFDAPKDGVEIKVVTNVPSSVIMPDIRIPQGQRSVRVPLEAGKPGNGTLVFTANGFEKCKIPVSVR